MPFKPIFATFNPNVAVEQNTALRMQAISGLYDMTVELPARAYSKGSGLSAETAQRIERCSFVLAFSLYKMSPTLQKELHYAMEQKKPIIVIYDRNVGKTINFKEYAYVQEVHVDFNKTELALHEIAQFLQRSLYTTTSNELANTKKEDSGLGVALGIVGIGLGLLALWEIAKK